MKKQLIATMAVVMGLAGSVSAPVQAAGVYSKVQSKGCVIVNGKLCDLSDVENSLEEWCQQIVNGSGNNCSVILLPGCNPISKPENNQPGQDDSNADVPEQDATDNLPEEEQPGQDSAGDSQPDDNAPETNQPSKPENNQPEQDNSGNNTPEVDTENMSYAEQVAALVNQERAKAGLSPVEMDVEISAAALVRTKEIKTSFSHTRPDGRSFSTVLTDNGIRFYGAGENIAWGQKSPEQVMNAWMNSDGHRANILNSKYTKLGVGHFQDGNGTNYWVQLFTY